MRRYIYDRLNREMPLWPVRDVDRWDVKVRVFREVFLDRGEESVRLEPS
jgi:hypothetical protein